MDKQVEPKASPGLSLEALTLVARRFRALSDPTRLQILQCLFPGELSVQDVCAATGLSQPTVSKHLGTLRAEQLVGRRKAGSFSYYRIVDPSIHVLCEAVCMSLAERFEQAHREFNGEAG